MPIFWASLPYALEVYTPLTEFKFCILILYFTKTSNVNVLKLCGAFPGFTKLNIKTNQKRYIASGKQTRNAKDAINTTILIYEWCPVTMFIILPNNGTSSRYMYA